jgi:hypothetical protein
MTTTREIGDLVFCGNVDGQHAHVYESGEGLRIVRPGRANHQDEFDPECTAKVFEVVEVLDRADEAERNEIILSLIDN